MKTRVYLRVARDKRGKARVVATVKPNARPLEAGGARPLDFLPTVAFAVDLNVPDSMFDQASRVVAELTISEDTADIAAEVREVQA